MAVCIFCKIASGDIPAKKVYEDERFLAFDDIRPQAPVHVLIIPKRHFETVLDVPVKEEWFDRLIEAAGKIAKDKKIDKDGFRLVINCRDNGGQTVYHLHLHLLGGRFMTWPPG